MRKVIYFTSNIHQRQYLYHIVRNKNKPISTFHCNFKKDVPFTSKQIPFVYDERDSVKLDVSSRASLSHGLPTFTLKQSQISSILLKRYFRVIIYYETIFIVKFYMHVIKSTEIYMHIVQDISKIGFCIGSSNQTYKEPTRFKLIYFNYFR